MPKRKQIVFQGEPGANSHLAIQEVYPKAEAVPCATFEDCFAAVTNGTADLAMIPIENSLAGRVADIHHLLPDSGLHIVGAAATGFQRVDPDDLVLVEAEAQIVAIEEEAVALAASQL